MERFRYDIGKDGGPEQVQENVERLSEFLVKFGHRELWESIVSWASMMFLLAEQVEVSETGLIWAGPETAETLIKRSTGGDFHRLASLLTLGPNPYPLDWQMYVMCDPRNNWFWPVPQDDEDIWLNKVDDSYAEVVRRMDAGETWEQVKPLLHLPTPGANGATEEEALRATIDANAAIKRLFEQWLRDDLPNINAAADEKLRIVREMDHPHGRQPREGMPKGTMGHIWASTIIWVSDEMTRLVDKMSITLPPDWVPHHEDLGVLPNNMLVMTAGDTFDHNVWHVNTLKNDEMGMIPIKAGEYLHRTTLTIFNAGTAMRDASPPWKAFWAFVLLANEPIAAHHREWPNRASQRRWQREEKDPSDVVVVTLRRPKEPASGNHRQVNWSHSWIVNPFWRNQWYPSLGYHKPKFIHAYVKGEGPLIVKNRVIRLSR